MKLLLATAILSLTGVSALADPSLGEPGAVWKSRKISVCWGTPEDTDRTSLSNTSKAMIKHSSFGVIGADDRLLVQKTITREYNLAETGVEFTGWKDCTENDTSDVMIFTSDISKAQLKSMDDLFLMAAEAGSYDGIASIGVMDAQAPLKQYVHIKKLASEELKVTPEESLQLVALHEFGHLTGLRHEHARFDSAFGDPNCIAQGQGLNEGRGKTAKSYGVYDPNSIMNYCYVFTVLYRTGIHFYVDMTSGLRTNVFNYFETMSSLPLISMNQISMPDETIFNLKESSETRNLYHVKIGLSKGDRHTLKCLYQAESYDPEHLSCHDQFKP